MSEEMIIRYCSPTLAGIKTGSLFFCSIYSEGELRESLRWWNRILSANGIRILLLSKRDGRALIYVYRPERLYKDLKLPEAERILADYDYKSNTVAGHLRELMERLHNAEVFPHEIGLFLGYPPEDVQGFIINGGAGYKYSGCWKVYGDKEQAKRIFAQYKSCTNAYLRLYAEGNSILELTGSMKQE